MKDISRVRAEICCPKQALLLFSWIFLSDYCKSTARVNLISSRGITFAVIATSEAFLLVNTERPVQVGACGKCLSASSMGAKGNHLNHE